MLTLRSVLPDVRNAKLSECAAAYQALTAVAEHLMEEAMKQPALSEKRRWMYGIWNDVSIVRLQVEFLTAEILEEQRQEMEEDE